MSSPITLSELNRWVRDALQLSLPREVWVVAEIAELRQAATGNVYLELVEKSEQAHGGEFQAKARANLWRSNADILLANFHQTTGQPLQVGMKILVAAQPVFHEVYGFSLTILAIDPRYTLGEMANRRQQILRQLEDDGVLELNRELTLPRPLQRIAVISAAGAAGYGDFTRQLEQSDFAFFTQLFPATMQGVNVEPSVIAALDQIAEEEDAWDCVVILRGGGAVSDLNGFDSYLLAANVAQFPLPVLTGIGHERDDTVVDLVAHTRFKTPTAVAVFLVELMQKAWSELDDYALQLTTAVRTLLERRHTFYAQMLQRYHQAAVQYLFRQHQGLNALGQTLEFAAVRQIQDAQFRLKHYPVLLQQSVRQLLERQQQLLKQYENTLQMSDPARILSLGYSLTVDAKGRTVRNTAQLAPGALITTYLADGTLTAEVRTLHPQS